MLDLAREAHGDRAGAGGETSVFELGGSWEGEATGGGGLPPDAGLLAGGGEDTTCLPEGEGEDEGDRRPTAAADLPPTLARLAARGETPRRDLPPLEYSPTPRRPRPSSSAPSELEDVLQETRVPAGLPAQSPSDAALDEQISALEQQISALPDKRDS